MPARRGERQPHITLPSYIQKPFARNWYYNEAGSIQKAVNRKRCRASRSGGYHRQPRITNATFGGAPASTFRTASPTSSVEVKLGARLFWEWREASEPPSCGPFP